MSSEKSLPTQLKEIFVLVLPAILEFAFQVMVIYSDYIMVGGLGIDASATIGITNEVSFLIKAGVNALGIGVVAYIAKEIGAGNRKQLKPAVVQAYVLTMVIGTLTTVIPLLISPVLPGLLGAEEPLRRPASVYFAISSVSGIFFAFNVVAGSVRKATKDMKTPLLINGIVNVLNVIFNWFFIYPDLSLRIGGTEVSIPRANMGVTGAAVGTALSVALGSVLMVVVNERVEDLSVRRMKKHLDMKIMKAYIAVGIPAFLTAIVTSFGRVIFTSMIIPLGTQIYAAHSIAFNAESAFYIPAVGMANAVAVMSGNVRGERDLRKLNRQTNLVCLLISGIMLVASVVMLLFAEPIISVFTSDADTIRLSSSLLRIVAVNEPMFGISIVMQYVFNGIGRTKPPLFISAFTQWAIRVLGVFVLVSVLGFGIHAAWICMIADNIVRAVLLYAWYWMSNRKLIVQKTGM